MGNITTAGRCRILAALAGTVACCVMGADAAQSTRAASPSRAAQWSQLASLPDWTGVWEIDWRNARKAPPALPGNAVLTFNHQPNIDQRFAPSWRGRTDPAATFANGTCAKVGRYRPVSLAMNACPFPTDILS